VKKWKNEKTRTETETMMKITK